MFCHALDGYEVFLDAMRCTGEMLSIIATSSTGVNLLEPQALLGPTSPTHNCKPALRP